MAVTSLRWDWLAILISLLRASICMGCMIGPPTIGTARIFLPSLSSSRTNLLRSRQSAPGSRRCYSSTETMTATFTSLRPWTSSRAFVNATCKSSSSFSPMRSTIFFFTVRGSRRITRLAIFSTVHFRLSPARTDAGDGSAHVEPPAPDRMRSPVRRASLPRRTAIVCRTSAADSSFPRWTDFVLPHRFQLGTQCENPKPRHSPAAATDIERERLRASTSENCGSYIVQSSQKTFYSERDSSAAPSQSQETPQTQNRAASPERVVEVSIAADGSASRIIGLDQLSSAQQFAWRDWLSTFASSMTYPKSGINTGQKWQTFEPETSPSPIAELSWAKQYQYVRDEPCRFADAEPKSGSGKPPSPPQPCAVIFVISTLRQKSSRKNATPEDYKLRNLKTRGTVAGHNETILYVSRSTGLLVRSIEDAQQTMDALIALEDGSNEVRYSVDAKSHSDISLLSGSPQSIR